MWYRPHGHCYLWEQALIAVHSGTDALFALSCVVMVVTLWFLGRKRPDIPHDLKILTKLLAMLILCCGGVHIFNIITIWYPIYIEEAVLKAFTAVVSCVAAFTLSVTFRKNLLNMASPDDSKRLNDELKQERRSRRDLEDYMVKSFALAPYGIAKVALDGHFIEVNDQFARIAGWTKAELESRTFQDITPKEDELTDDLKFVEEMKQRKRQSYQMRKHYITSTGDIVPVVLTVFLIWQGDEPAYFISQIREAA